MAGEIVTIIFVQLLLAVIVANYARKSGRNELAWFIIVALFGIFGIALYVYDTFKNQPSRNTLRVTGEVVDQDTEEKSTVALNTSAGSVTGAENQFIEKCSYEGYQVESGSLKVQSIITGPDPAETQSMPFRPGKNLLPDGRVKSWYEVATLDDIIGKALGLTILSIFVIGMLSTALSG